MFEFIVRNTFQEIYPGASAGVLVVRGAANPELPSDLRQRTQAVEDQLRQQYSGWTRAELAALPVIQAYSAYYRRFKKTYHVQLQLESIVLKGRSLPRTDALLEAMFSAEIKNLLLTAGHDLSAVQGPVKLDAARGEEDYVTLSGENKTLKPGDMFMSDQQGIISSVLYGPDARTRLTPTTRDALFTVYAPPGIQTEVVRSHLEDIRDGVLLASPQAQVELLDVFFA
jgi:DNA/RNA-binding domain of Phe-tRNA-synthetase-like protein